MLDCRRQIAIDDRDQHRHEHVDDEPEPLGVVDVHVQGSRRRFGNPARQRAERPHQRAGEVVAGERACQAGSRLTLGQRCLLDRQKHADVA